MSLKIIKERIDSFLSTDIPEVLAIKGSWGVGKTFTWNKFLKEASIHNKISLSRYSYVSLFGINSLESLKYSIFEHSINQKDIGIEPFVDSFKENAGQLAKKFGRQGISLFKSTNMGKGFSTAIDSLAFLSLSNSIICIDDFERKGSGLENRDILGLISMLKEQKGCKVVLLLNDSEEGLEEYEKYKEKVLDSELVFSLTPQECTSVAIEGNSKDKDLLRECIHKLALVNIRVIKKIERLIKLTEIIGSQYCEEIQHQVVHSLTLFTWCYYCSQHDEKVPSFEYVTGQGYSFWGIGEKNKDPKEKAWNATLIE